MHTCEQAPGAVVHEVTCVWAKLPDCSFEDICANSGGCGYATASSQGGLMELKDMTCKGTITDIEELAGDVQLSCDMQLTTKCWVLMALAGILLLAGLFWLIFALRNKRAASATAASRSRKLEERRLSVASTAHIPSLSTSANGTSRSSSVCSSSTSMAQSQAQISVQSELQPGAPTLPEEMMQPKSDLEANVESREQESREWSPEASQDDESLPSAMSVWRRQQLLLQQQLQHQDLETRDAESQVPECQHRVQV